MERKRRVLVVLIIIALIFLTTFCVWPVIRLNFFYDSEARAVAKFDALNSELFATIPVPDGVVELEQSRNGIITLSTEHGRYLRTKYNISQTQPDIVLDHYNGFFLSNGWEETIAYEGFSSYFRGTSCVNLHFYGANYSLNIWHDFWKQDFSPHNPNTWLLNVIEFGESSFAVCPP